MEATQHSIVWLEHAQQRLGLVPTLGGSVAAWQWLRAEGPFDCWRPWDGAKPDRYTVACFPLVPWSNRISGGGFEHDGRFYPVAPNRVGEPYPIHGDGWLQAWACEQDSADSLALTLESCRFDGDPYVYRAQQRFTLVDGGMDQLLRVTHLGDHPLPYGLGLHPYFARNERTRIAAPVRGVWLSGADPLPVEHSSAFAPTWDLSDAPAQGPFIDNCYTGWSGEARLRWPEAGVQLSMRVPAIAQPGEPAGSPRRDDGPGYCLLYRPPPDQPFFCLEPVTHPIDAFHLAGRPGLQVLQQGQDMSLVVQWRFAPLEG